MNSDRVFLAIVPLLRPWVSARGRARQAQFEAVPPSPGQIVLLGDSITQGGLWDALLPGLPVVNRGIDGNTTEDILGRLDSAIVAPKAVSLLIGTNDLHGAPRLKDIHGIAGRTRQILGHIRSMAPEAKLIVNSVLPRTTLLAPRIQELNELYRVVAAEEGATYLDLWPAMSDGRGALRKEFTTDNLHLRPAGYRAWAAILAPELSSGM